MLTHKVQNENDGKKNVGLPRYNRKDKDANRVLIPYIMQTEHGQVSRDAFAGGGLGNYFNKAVPLQMYTNERENGEYAALEAEHSQEYDTCIVMQQKQDQPPVVQREFDTLSFELEVYLKQIRKSLNEEWKTKSITELIDQWHEDGINSMVDWPSFIGEDGNELTEEEKDEIQEEFDLNNSRLDILMNLCEHFISKAGGNEYEHYLMLDEDTMEKEDGILNSEKAELLSAIDCKPLKRGEGTDYFKKPGEQEGEETPSVLWIESFVSMQKGMGKKLLLAMLEERSEKEVALGVYPGTEDYYTNSYGFEPMKGYYSGEDKASVMDTETARNYVVEKLGEDMENVFSIGMEKCLIYPVYRAERGKIIKKIKGGTKPAGERRDV